MPTKLDCALEKVVIQEYLRNQGLFEGAIISYPDPPDCVFKKNGKKGWIEVTALYRHWEEKKSCGEMRYEYLGTDSKYIEEFKQGIIKRIKKKDKKPNYNSFTKKFGEGVLILFTNDPFFTIIGKLDAITYHGNFSQIKLTNFHSVYLYEFPNAIGPKSGGMFPLILD